MAHLAFRFASHPENIATEALCYILQRAPAAREALVGVCRDAGANVPLDLRFRSQVVGHDGTIPDLAGVGHDGQEHLLIEAKFWAELTDQQPVAYLRRLQPASGLLLVLVPSARRTTLWDELRRRCEADGLPFRPVVPEQAGMRTARLQDDAVRLALTDWPLVLALLARALAAAQEVQLAEDLAQLRGLCERMDSESFLPLRGEELAAASPRRLLQLGPLVDDLVVRAQQNGCDTHGLRPAATAGGYGRYMRLTRNDVGLYVSVDFRKWAHLASTPLWLRITGPGWKANPMVRDVLQPLEQSAPTRLFADPDDSTLLSVPLFPPLGVERDRVIADLVDQLVEVLHLLDTLPAPQAKVVLPQPIRGSEVLADRSDPDHIDQQIETTDDINGAPSVFGAL